LARVEIGKVSRLLPVVSAEQDHPRHAARILRDSTTRDMPLSFPSATIWF
jgi:hypothetical protein